ncbi:hypothetical protein T10_2594 [Trichinella papuae]|uniref:Uncharacterized protein n=1 Tax=Trichinella papuae TaxID=268474 RepID=A0A0V1MRU3_9BILA|nr:hypothetical protein T10_2594 [Trichinella papuae]
MTNWHELPAAPCYDRHQHPRSCSRWDIKTSKQKAKTGRPLRAFALYWLVKA